MSTLPITEPMRQITLQALKNKGLSQKDLADKLGVGKPWVTKLFNGSLLTLKEELLWKIEDILGIKYFTLERVMGTRSPLAEAIAADVDTDPIFARLVTSLQSAIAEARASFSPRQIPQHQLAELGREIIDAVETHKTQPERVARVVMGLLVNDPSPKAPNLQVVRVADDFRPRAHVLAAAGSPIGAEVEEWDGADDTVMVKINGLSMVPTLNDGDVVAMKHKRAARSPFMKKGLVYLVEYDGGYTVKRYDTRPATEEEAGEEWVERGKVKILKSENPDFPEIVIKGPIDWIAWLEDSSARRPQI